MMCDLAAFALTQAGRSVDPKVTRELQLLSRDKVLNLSFSDYHSRNLEFSLGAGRFISPATHLFGQSNSFGIEPSKTTCAELTINMHDLSIYGVKQDLIQNINIALSAGTLIGSGISTVLGSPIMGPIGLVIGTIALIVAFHQKEKAEREQRRLLSKMGSELANMMAYTTNLHAIKQLITEGLISLISSDEFNQVVDIDKIQQSFGENFGYRTLTDNLKSLEVYTKQMEELSRLIDDKKPVNSECAQINKILTEFFGKETEKVFKNIGCDQLSSEESNEIARRLALLYVGPRDFRVENASTSKGSTLIISSQINSIKDRRYINVEVADEAVSFVGSLAKEVSMGTSKFENLSFMCREDAMFEQELDGISVSGRIVIAGYLGVSLIRPILLDAYHYGAILCSQIGKFSVELNSDSDIYSEYTSEMGYKVKISNCIKTTDRNARFTLTTEPQFPTVQMGTRQASDFSHHFSINYLEYMIKRSKVPNDYLLALDPIKRIGVGTSNHLKEGNKFFIEWTACLPSSLRMDNNSSVVMSLKEATLLNQCHFMTIEEFREYMSKDRLLAHFSIPERKIEVTELITTKRIRVYEGAAMAIMTTNGYPYADVELPCYGDNLTIFMIPSDIEENIVFSGRHRGGPQFGVILVKGVKRAWQALE